MNKLEQLKALIAEENKWRREWINAEMALDACEDVWSLSQKYYSAKRNRAALSDDLLPQLIAGAEAAKNLDSLIGGKQLAQLGPEVAKALVSQKRIVQDLFHTLTKDTDK